MSLDTIVQLVITAQSKAPTQAGFGTALIFGFHNKWTDSRVHTYADADELLDEGFTADHPIYKAAVALKSQNPAPPQFKVGRRAVVHTTTLDPTTHTIEGNVLTAIIDGHTVTHTVTAEEDGNKGLVVAGMLASAHTALDAAGYTLDATSDHVIVVAPNDAIVVTTGLVNITAATVDVGPPQQTIQIIPTKLSTGFTYTGTVGGKPVTYTVASDDAGNLASVCTAIAAVLNALSLAVTVSATSTYVQIRANSAGTMFDFAFNREMYMQDVTVDSGVAADLTAIREEDDDWYELLVVDNNAETIETAAAYIEPHRKIFQAQTADYKCKIASASDDIMSVLKTAGYARTQVSYHDRIGGISWLAAGVAGFSLPTTPGAATLAHKSVAGVPTVDLKPGQENAILAKNGSIYTNVAGNGDFFEGKAASGDFLDTVRFIDWLYARIRERVIFVLQNNPKIPYTDFGVDLIRGAVLSVLQQGIAVGGLSDSPAPQVSAPKVADVDPAMRINRILPDVKFTAQLAGAIHRLQISGVISI